MRRTASSNVIHRRCNNIESCIVSLIFYTTVIEDNWTKADFKMLEELLEKTCFLLHYKLRMI